jgi:LysR family carnitine catabolism transcriptional activator
MDLTVRQLRAFLAVADEANFSAAAVRLRTAQSNLSRIVGEMELALGSALFLRTTRTVKLTDEGLALVDSARRIVEVHAHEMSRFAETVRGRVGVARIAALPSVALAVLPAFYERMFADHPGIQIDLREGAADDISNLLLDDEVQVGIGLQPEDSGRIVSEQFISDHFVAIVSAGSALARRDSLTWRELADETFVALSSQTSVRQLADATFRRLGFAPRSSIHAPNTASVAGLVARGLGVSALPGLALGLFDYPGLIRLPLVQPQVTRRLQLLQRRDLAQTRVGAHTVHALRQLREDGAPLPYGASWADPDEAHV